jgi:hypothetical protein
MTKSEWMRLWWDTRKGGRFDWRRFLEGTRRYDPAIARQYEARFREIGLM